MSQEQGVPISEVAESGEWCFLGGVGRPETVASVSFVRTFTNQLESAGVSVVTYSVGDLSVATT